MKPVNKLFVIVEHGMVRELYGAMQSEELDLEILDLDSNGSDPEAAEAVRKRSRAVRESLNKLY